MTRIGHRHSAETRAKISAGQWGKVRKPAAEIDRSALHKWLRRHFSKNGACENCGKEGRTDWAFLGHPEPHTRDRIDYAELCRRCHMYLDGQPGKPRYGSPFVPKEIA